MSWPVSTHGGDVNSVAISEDGSVVIAGTCLFTPLAPGAPVPPVGTYAYKADSTKLWEDVAAVPAGDIGVYWVGVSRDGQWAVSGGGNHKVPPPSPLGVGYLNVYYVDTGQKQQLLNGNIGGVNAVALSEDGSYLVAGADAAYVFERQGQNFVQIQALKDALTPADNVVAVAISRQLLRVVYATTASQLVLHAPALGANIAWHAPQNHILKWVAMAADGDGFAAVTTNAPFAKAHGVPFECNAYFFDLKPGSGSFVTTQQPAQAWQLPGCTGTLSVAINADASRVAAVGNVPTAANPTGTAGKVFFFDTQSNNPLWVQDTTYGPNAVSTDDKSTWVAASDGFKIAAGNFYLFTANGVSVPLPTPSHVSWAIQVAAQGAAVAAGTDDGEVYYFVPAPVAPAAPTNLRVQQY